MSQIQDVPLKPPNQGQTGQRRCCSFFRYDCLDLQLTLLPFDGHSLIPRGSPTPPATWRTRTACPGTCTAGFGLAQGPNPKALASATQHLEQKMGGSSLLGYALFGGFKGHQEETTILFGGPTLKKTRPKDVP